MQLYLIHPSGSTKTPDMEQFF